MFDFNRSSLFTWFTFLVNFNNLNDNQVGAKHQGVLVLIVLDLVIAITLYHPH